MGPAMAAAAAVTGHLADVRQLGIIGTRFPAQAGLRP